FRAAESLDQVQGVIAADPHMGVYGLGAAVLRHQAGDPNADAAYAAALESAPTWDAGWINRAALAEARGDDAAALAYLDRARAIDRFNGAALHYARIAERTGADDLSDLVDAYRLGFDYLNLPLSAFWGETPARREAVGSLAADWTADAPDLAYRLLRVHAPEQIAALTAVVESHDPPKPGDWWVLGEEALRAGDAAAAFDWMDRAARAARTNGDYYASRARARIALDPADPVIEIDLRLAELLGARYESPNAIRAEIAPDEETRRRLWANAVPPQVVAQNFEGVSYAGRGVGFWIAPSMRPPGVGLAVLQPWVALAESYAAAGEVEAAEAVRRAIAERR
ncbi:MAG: hypothetical protein JNL42_20235, partial [Anaerolineae bacterium]|nr:hypothetical protein [Anaerolineae bacterium]